MQTQIDISEGLWSGALLEEIPYILHISTEHYKIVIRNYSEALAKVANQLIIMDRS
jgi:hypothetical protein